MLRKEQSQAQLKERVEQARMNLDRARMQWVGFSLISCVPVLSWFHKERQGALVPANTDSTSFASANTFLEKEDDFIDESPKLEIDAELGEMAQEATPCISDLINFSDKEIDPSAPNMIPLPFRAKDVAEDLIAEVMQFPQSKTLASEEVEDLIKLIGLPEPESVLVVEPVKRKKDSHQELLLLMMGKGSRNNE